MLNNFKIVHSYRLYSIFSFKNLFFLKKMLGSFYKNNKQVTCVLLKKSNKNVGNVLKESPFHYPVAKKVLDDSSFLFKLESSFYLNKSIVNKHSIVKLIRVFSKKVSFLKKTNSFFFLETTTYTFSYLYKPNKL